MRLEWMEKYMADAEKLIYENKVEEGLKLLDGLLYEEPGYGSLHNHIGWAYFYYTSEAVRAELHLKLAIKFDPDFAAPYQHLGNLYIRAGRYTEAMEYLQKGIRINNANRTALLESMGHVYELKREYGKAIHSYKEALASTVGFETANLTECIKRCRKKRWVMMFNF
jgi:Putative Zn-dependent protease, contains TPR repeats